MPNGLYLSGLKIIPSLDEFAEAIRDAAPRWAAGQSVEKADSLKKKPGLLFGQSASWMCKQAFEAFWKSKFDTTGQHGTMILSVAKGDGNPQIKEEVDLKIDKSKMTPEEQATLAEFEKKYGITEPEVIEGVLLEAQPEIHPDVKKALAEFEEVKKAQATEIEKQTAELERLRKSVEVERFIGFAKKYEVLGKKPDEMGQKLYDLKKAGGTAYDDYVALLDEHLTTVEKSGLFKELGKNTSGSADVSDKLNMAASEFKKSVQGLNNVEALIKAFEENPELARQYDNEYMGGRQ